MPANVVKAWARDTPASKKTLEKKWDRAETAAGEQGKKKNYAYRMAIFKKMTQKDRWRSKQEAVSNGFNAYTSNMAQTRSRGSGGSDGTHPPILDKKMTYNQKHKIKKAMEATMTDRAELRNFILENAEELDELTVSANLAIPTNIGGFDSDEEIPRDVHDHEVDDVDSTEDDERTGKMGIKAGSGSKDPRA